jgi:hypothetical protein
MMEAALNKNAIPYIDQQCHDPDTPRSWKWYFLAIEIGKGAVGGAGLFIALAGLINLIILLFTSIDVANTAMFYATSIIGAVIGGGV